jgi:cell division protein FtsB
MPPQVEMTHRGTLAACLGSLAFWLCLFVAAALYAAVALSSKLVVHETSNAAFEANQWRLVALERQVSRLRMVTAAQRDDQAFLREQARSDFAISRPDEERIPVEPHLTLHIGAGRPESSARRDSFSACLPLLRLIAGSRGLSDALLATAAALVIGAFTFFPAKGATDSATAEFS